MNHKHHKFRCIIVFSVAISVLLFAYYLYTNPYKRELNRLGFELTYVWPFLKPDDFPSGWFVEDVVQKYRKTIPKENIEKMILACKKIGRIGKIDIHAESMNQNNINELCSISKIEWLMLIVDKYERSEPGHLDLSSSTLTWLILQDISSSLDDDDLKGISKANRLDSLGINGGKFSNAGIEYLSNNGCLRSLKITGQFATNKEIRKASDFPKLQELTVRGTLKDSRSLDFIRQMPNLTHLCIDVDEMTDEHLSALENIKDLKVMFIKGNLDSIDSLPFHQWPNLERVILSGNRLKSLPESFSTLVNLKELNLSDNELTDESMAHIPRAPDLEKMYLNGNKLKGSLSESFTGLVSLEYLDLRNNQIDDEGLSQFPYISSRIQIDLRDNPIAGHKMDAVNRMPRIQFLDLSGTLISDETVDNIDIDHRGPPPSGTMDKHARYRARASTVWVPKETVSDEKIEELNKTKYQHGSRISKGL